MSTLFWVLLGVGGLVALFVGGVVLWMITLRRVVPTNEVHIVQSGGVSTVYGREVPTAEGRPAQKREGNTYYEWPMWVPGLGVQVTKLPESIFPVQLKNYEAYDSNRLPFIIDVAAFFRIDDAEIAAQRVSSIEELENNLENVLQGAVRRVLGTNKLEEIMHSRGELGKQFTEEVQEDVTQWGVTPVKSVEFMDIRDSVSSQGTVIKAIMDKERSRIDKESRIKVAENHQLAEAAEINAKRTTEIQRQDAAQQVGLRTAQKEQAVGIANEESRQAVLASEKETKTRHMAVAQVEQVRSAEIAKDVQIVKANMLKETNIIAAGADKEIKIVTAEGEREAQVIKATGDLEEAKRHAEGILSEGQAKAEAEKLMLMAPVEAQTALAKEIGENKPYQEYLLSIEKIRVDGEVGKAYAATLEKAEIKIIANTGDAATGIRNVGEVFTPKGGTSMGGMLEALSQTDAGKRLVDKFTSFGSDNRR